MILDNYNVGSHSGDFSVRPLTPPRVSAKRHNQQMPFTETELENTIFQLQRQVEKKIEQKRGRGRGKKAARGEARDLG